MKKAILGIDISKKTFDATLVKNKHQKEHHQFENTPKGFEQLQKWLNKQGVEELHACMEATNIYWERVAEYLYQQGYEVSVVNPARIKGHASAQMKRHKTDKVDSIIIADFCQKNKPKRWHPPTPEQKKLRALVRHLETLKKGLRQEKQRLIDCTEPVVQNSLQTIIQHYQTQISLIETQIADFIDQDPDLKHKHSLLTSIKGIGSKTASFLLAEMYDLPDYDNARAAAADAGLTPSSHQSGTSVRRKPRLSKMGKSSVRAALYWPAKTAIRHNPIIRAFSQKLLDRGKHYGVVVVASMRKLLHLAFGVLKNNTPFDPDFLSS